jgi:hypothetical protein
MSVIKNGRLYVQRAIISPTQARYVQHTIFYLTQPAVCKAYTSNCHIKIRYNTRTICFRNIAMLSNAVDCSTDRIRERTNGKNTRRNLDYTYIADTINLELKMYRPFACKNVFLTLRQFVMLSEFLFYK